MKEPTTFPVTRKVLDELNELALSCPNLFASHLSYRQTQQALTIYALIEFFQQHGIELPFHLELTDDTSNPRTSRPR